MATAISDARMVIPCVENRMVAVNPLFSPLLAAAAEI